MAKIKFGMMMTDARGKLGGQVFSKNRAGAYIRTKVTPTNPQTSAQAQVRSNLATLSTGWNSLTAPQIAQWNGSVEDWASTDVFGDIKKPTGKNLYVKLNVNLLNSGQSAIVTPPAKIELPALVDIAVDVTIATGTLEIDGLPVFADGVYQVEACAPVPRGVNFVKNKFRVISYETQATAGVVDVSTAYINRFGSVANAENIFFRIRAIGENGQAGVPLVVKANF
jgi:hypothetical protein